MKRTLVAVALAVIFMLALAAPAFAFTLSSTYDMEGVINYKLQAGHACNTGGVLKQTIAGSGKMDKVMDIAMVPGRLTVSDTNNWVAGATPLTVTSVWELCTPPKYTYDGKTTAADGGMAGKSLTAPVGIDSLYPFATDEGDFYMPAEWNQATKSFDGMTVKSLAKRFGWDALTDQIWAVQVAADPGFSGNLSQKGEAAYGPYWDNKVATFDTVWTKDGSNYSDTWRWEKDKDGLWDIGIGKDYVGDYFTMEQHARTSQGTLRRYIDMSSPWSHAYLHEDMSVVGKSDIKEAFKMDNLPAGKDMPKDWWRLF